MTTKRANASTTTLRACPPTTAFGRPTLRCHCPCPLAASRFRSLAALPLRTVTDCETSPVPRPTLCCGWILPPTTGFLCRTAPTTLVGGNHLRGGPSLCRRATTLPGRIHHKECSHCLTLRFQNSSHSGTPRGEAINNSRLPCRSTASTSALVPLKSCWYGFPSSS